MISCIITTYNSERTIAYALESVIRQSYPVHEVIIVDDSSTDSTLEIIESKISLFEKFGIAVNVHCNSFNAGPSYSRNVGISNAKGKYLAFLDSDDIWHPDKLSIQVSIMENDTSILACGSNHVEFISHDECFLFSSPFKLKYEAFSISKRISFLSCLLKNPIVTPSLLVRNKGDSNIYFNQNLKYCEDKHYISENCFVNNVLKLKLPLVAIYRPKNHLGLSSNLLKMRLGELKSFFIHYKSGRLNIFQLYALVLQSILKYLIKAITRNL